MCCYVNQLGDKKEITLKLIFEDKMERELTSELKIGIMFRHVCSVPLIPNNCVWLYIDDEASALGWDLVMNGLINEVRDGSH